MNDNTRQLDINIGDSDKRLEELDAAVDLASDQDQRTVITAGGKRIAAVVTAEDLKRLEALCAELDYRGVTSQPDVAAALTIILADLDGPDPIVTRVVQAQAALRVLLGQVRQVPGTSGRSENDIISRLAEILHTLGVTCDAAGMAGRSPAVIAKWLRYGDAAL